MKTLITTIAIALTSTAAVAEVNHKNFNGASATAANTNETTQQWTNDAAWHYAKLTEHAQLDGSLNYYQYRYDLATQVWNKGIQGAGVTIGIVDDFNSAHGTGYEAQAAAGADITHGGRVARTARLFAPKQSQNHYNWDKTSANATQQVTDALAIAAFDNNDIVNLSLSAKSTHGNFLNKIEDAVKGSKSLFVVAAGNQGQDCNGFGLDLVSGWGGALVSTGSCNTVAGAITGQFHNTSTTETVNDYYQHAYQLESGEWVAGHIVTKEVTVNTEATGWTRESGVNATQGIIVGALRDGVIADYSNAAGHDYALDTIFAEAGEGFLAGTSIAAPTVAGVAALVMDKFDTNAWATKQILLQTATDLGAPGVDKVYGRGALNIAAALAPVGVAW